MASDRDWETLRDEPVLEDDDRTLLKDTQLWAVRREALECWIAERELEREPRPTFDEL